MPLSRFTESITERLKRGQQDSQSSRSVQLRTRNRPGPTSSSSKPLSSFTRSVTNMKKAAERSQIPSVKDVEQQRRMSLSPEVRNIVQSQQHSEIRSDDRPGMFTDRLPNFFQQGERIIRTALFGDPREREQIRQLQKRGYSVPFREQARSAGLTPVLGETTAEKFDASFNRQIGRGVDEDRAREVARADVVSRGALPGDIFHNELDKVDLNDNEKRGVFYTRKAGEIGAGLDALSFLPMGQVFRVPKATLSSSLKGAKTTGQARKVLRDAGVADDVADTYASRFARETDDDVIRKGVDSLEVMRQQTDSLQVTGEGTVMNAFKTDPSIPIPTNKFSTNEVSAVRQSPPPGVAMRTMRDGTERAAVRNSGIYAPKEFEMHQGKDIEGLLGGLSFNLDDGLISWDNLRRSQLAKLGEVGPGERLAYKGREVDARMLEYGDEQASNIRDIARRHGLDFSDEATDIQTMLGLHGITNEAIRTNGARQAIIDALRRADVSDEAIGQSLRPGFMQRIKRRDSKVMEAIKDGLPQNIENALPDLRRHFDAMLGTVNPVRKSLGKVEVPRRENYAPIMQQNSFWSKMRPSKKTEVVDNFDYIIPNAKKNPHALMRRGGADDIEWRFSEAATRYHESIARDLFDSPFIEELKAVNSVLKGRGYHNASRLIERHIREARVGQPAQLDSFFGITEGTKKRTILNKLNTARTIQALSANLVWIGFVQPASTIMTFARSGPINMASGILEFATNSHSRAYLNKLPTIRTKMSGMSLGSTGAGDLDALGSKIVKGKLERFSDFSAKIADANEYWLTGSASLAGRKKAKRLGLTGESVDIYADWMGGATQSRYNRTARPMITNNILLRTSFPFQTYAFELYRYAKTLAGRPGGRPLEMRERVNQALLLLGGMYTYDAYLEKAIGRRLATESVQVGDHEVTVPRVGTWVPMAGDQADDLVHASYRALGVDSSDRRFSAGRSAAGAVHEDAKGFVRSIDDYIRYNNPHPLRKELVKWGMGFKGAPGASTVNRLVDGLMATATGYQTNVQGNRLFRIEGVDKYLSPLLGPYSTQAGIEFIKEGASIVERDARKEIQRLDNMPRSQAADEFEEIRRHNPNLARQIIKMRENEDNPILGKVRDLSISNGMRAEAIVDEMEKLETNEDRAREYEKLKDAGVVTDEISRQVRKVMEEQAEAAVGQRPDMADGEPRSDRSLLQTVGLYAKAIGADPLTAFSRMFAGEEIRRVDNGAIIVHRMGTSDNLESLQRSEQVRRARARDSELRNLRLDHVVPLQLGGSNRDDNLLLVSVNEWAAYTPVENLLGDYLRAGRIDRNEAQRVVKEFKEGDLPPAEIYEKYPPFRGDLFERFHSDILESLEGSPSASKFEEEIFRIYDNPLGRPND